MSRVKIYYFSGSGNSLTLARDLADELDAELIALSSLRKQAHYFSEAESIGFVFPVVDFKAPDFVIKMLQHFKDLQGKYIFALCCFGLSAGNCMKLFDKELRKLGGELSAGFTAAMPHNGIGSDLFTLKEQEKAFCAWQEKMPRLLQSIKNQEKLKLEKGSIFHAFFVRGLFFRTLSTMTKLMLLVARKGWQALDYTATEACNGCGSCVKICPVENISLREKRPYWGDDCANCFACLHWCPQKAIQLGEGKIKVRNYHHPKVSLKDMVAVDKG